MANTYERYCIKKTLKLQHGVDLTDAQLDTIEEIYINSKRSNIFQVGMYRFINFVIGVVAVMFFLLIRGTMVEKWFFLGFFALFSIYNAIHCLNGYFEFKRVKKTNELLNDIDKKANGN